MGGLVKELKGKPIIINGMADHVHMLILLPPNVSVSDAMRFVKANSSRWVKERFGKKFRAAEGIRGVQRFAFECRCCREIYQSRTASPRIRFQD